MQQLCCNLNNRSINKRIIFDSLVFYMCCSVALLSTTFKHLNYLSWSVHVFIVWVEVFMCSSCELKCSCVHHVSWSVHVFIMWVEVFMCSSCELKCSCVHHVSWSVHVFIMWVEGRFVFVNYFSYVDKITSKNNILMDIIRVYWLAGELIINRVLLMTSKVYEIKYKVYTRSAQRKRWFMMTSLAG